MMFHWKMSEVERCLIWTFGKICVSVKTVLVTNTKVVMHLSFFTFDDAYPSTVCLCVCFLEQRRYWVWRESVMQCYNSCRLLIHGHGQGNIKQRVSGFLHVCKGSAFAQQCLFPLDILTRECVLQTFFSAHLFISWKTFYLSDSKPWTLS